eukprot:CAMPEP_0194323902 /NCGR_PEP_ID=MMETSP0171-20130528/26032_1 /TAXON_ID=218684 /ORGANISM="Corethron pennatum, Strain L29A3" /LENGTH=122 /DNA_ID=CAMNT_0039082649 /DNA_START=165 /DNA_END=533 /DNA_ORIENTATION=-
MATVQEKLLQCIGTKNDSGESATFSQVANLLNPVSATATVDEDVDMGTTDGAASASNISSADKKNKKKKHWIENAPGQTGAKLARKKISNAKKRGKFGKGGYKEKITVRKSRKVKRSAKCSF